MRSLRVYVYVIHVYEDAVLEHALVWIRGSKRGLGSALEAWLERGMGRGLEHGGVGGSFAPSRALEIRTRIRVKGTYFGCPEPLDPRKEIDLKGFWVE